MEAWMAEQRRRREEVIQKIRSFYNVGVPFFRKEAIRDVYQQLLKATNLGQKIWVMGLNGVGVEFGNETGKIASGSPPDEPEKEFFK
jgi:hypothetical protein